MNLELETYAREYIKINIKKLSSKHIMLFKRMYSEEDLAAHIDDVVEEMPKDKLDWAMKQVARSLNKEGIEIWSFQKTSTN